MSNTIGLDVKDYQGSKSTLCTGCGHDSVTNHIIQAYFRSGVNPLEVAKLSGIGCSSKTPAYFMSTAHGFNSIHGRMAAVATGAKVANRDLRIVGISGDGDTASIGLSGFLHLVRRNLPMVYIVENNGVYGLTKGQFSATADKGVPLKSGEPNSFSSLDLCALAIEAGCSFVARSFSGDAKQLVPLVQAAIEHSGTAFIDVISPCVTYANHDGSTKSYDYVREHKVALQELGFILEKEAQTADYAAGESEDITLASGHTLRLKKLNAEHKVHDKISALSVIETSRQKGEIVTGLIYHTPSKENLLTALHLPNVPLTKIPETSLKPDPAKFQSIVERFA